MSDDIEKTLEEIEALFAQTAHEMTCDGDKVTFHGMSPATLYFSDRPQRVVGHLTTKQFVDEWSVGENSFAEDPPNAVISFVERGDTTPEDAIVVLKDPKLRDPRRSPTRSRCWKATSRPRVSWSPSSSTRSGARCRCVGRRHAPARAATRAPLARR